MRTHPRQQGLYLVLTTFLFFVSPEIPIIGNVDLNSAEGRTVYSEMHHPDPSSRKDLLPSSVSRPPPGSFSRVGLC